MRSAGFLGFLALGQLQAGEDIIAPADLDGDGDSDSLGNYEEFEMEETVDGGLGPNFLYHGADSAFEYFVSGQPVTVWNDFVNPGDADKYMGAHLREPITPGGTFGFGQNFKLALTDPTYGMRESTERLPAGTLMYLGLRSSTGPGAYTGDSIELDANLSAIDLSGNAAAPATYVPFAGGFGSGSDFDWFSFEVDSVGTMSEWTFKTKNEKTGTADPLLQWVLHVDLPAGESVGTSTPWDVTGNDPDPFAIADDLVFAWTVNSKNKKNEPPTNLTYNPIPEPTSYLYLLLGAVGLVARRRRQA